MDWFADFYEKDYFHYRYAPRLDEVPQAEVDFILRHGVAPCGKAPEQTHIFDICCGIGRHGRPLAEAGCRVTGVDLSTPNIATANELAAKAGLTERCSFIQGDIREFTAPQNCDVAINIFTSFGYFEDEQADSIIFQKATESLRSGGRFILDVNNRERMVANPPKPERRGDDDNYVTDTSTLDLESSRMTCNWTFVRDGKSSEHTIRIRLYCLHELIAMAEKFDMKFIEAWGDFDDTPYSATSRRCIFIAEKL